MIGQKNLLEFTERLVNEGKFPQFAIFVGARGSGKKTIASHLQTKMRTENGERPHWVGLCDLKIDTIRDMIVDAYKRVEMAAYLIPNADEMSLQAKNALLKIVEEPPKNAYFIMTLEDEANTLQTILSRATIYRMERYTPDEIEEYYQIHAKGDNAREREIVRNVCDTPGEVDILNEYGIEEFYNYVEKVVDNIITAPYANVFKISAKISVKADDDGYDIRLFWKAFCQVCADRYMENQSLIQYWKAVRITTSYLQSTKIRGINKQGLLDLWIMDIRKNLETIWE